jgi:hypothetical protein
VLDKVNIEEEIKKSYLEYSLSVIIGRAIPDVRDGLKPVHRRILFAMHELGNTYNRPYKKSARIVGDVIGKYHPHGDAAVYDALVRMAQDFNMRDPLVDGQGNFGSIDGDAPAAMRYTEAKLRAIAEEMLFDIEKKPSAAKLLNELDQRRASNTINLGVLTRVGNAYLLRYKGEDNWSSDLSTASQALDVNVLHQLILKPACGIDTRNQHDLGHLAYVRGNEPPLEMIKNVPDYDFVFFVNPPDLDQIFDVAETGETMPQKSTYFYPKVYSGLVTAGIGD